MQVRTFTGSSSATVMTQIKAEMGPDAVILSSRTVQEDGRSRHEITAGIERAAHQAEELPAGQNSAERSAFVAPPGWDEWHRDWNLIKEHLLAFMKPGIRLDELTPRQRLAVEYLMREGMDDQTLFTLFRNLSGRPDSSVLEALDDLAPVRPWILANWPQEIHVLCGPSGVGKSTAALRMALALRREDARLPVLFVNADCERGIGRLLVRHFSDLSDMDYREAADAGAMLKALRDWSSENGAAGKIFVDLPALARQEKLTDQLARLGLTGTGIAVHLALSPLASQAQQQEYLRRYACRDEGTSLVWTKLDEAAAFGGLVNTGAASGLPVSALSFGSGMADTLVPAHAGHLWRLVFKHQFPEQTG